MVSSATASLRLAAESRRPLTVSLSHDHREVLHSPVGVAEPAAVEGEVDGRFAD